MESGAVITPFLTSNRANPAGAAAQTTDLLGRFDPPARTPDPPARGVRQRPGWFIPSRENIIP
jgi:hypothetical protein